MENMVKNMPYKAFAQALRAFKGKRWVYTRLDPETGLRAHANAKYGYFKTIEGGRDGRFATSNL